MGVILPLRAGSIEMRVGGSVLEKKSSNMLGFLGSLGFLVAKGLACIITYNICYISNWQIVDSASRSITRNGLFCQMPYFSETILV